MKKINNHFTIRLTGCTVIGVTLLLSSCDKEDEDCIDPSTIELTYTFLEGEWYEDDFALDTQTFNSDGSMYVGLKEGNYSIENGCILVQTLSDGSVNRFTVIEKDVDKIWIRKPTGNISTLTRL